MQEFVIALLNADLPAQYFYHNTAHTQYVFDKVIEIGTAENCTADEIELLKVAALWHDAGYIHVYNGHEEAGCLLARKYLPAYGFSINEIDKICGMIMATRIPQSPNNKLEEIVADADLEYLGTADAPRQAYQLFRELQHLNPAMTEAIWNKVQVSFIARHHYFTNFCKTNREPSKSAYLKALIEQGG